MALRLWRAELEPRMKINRYKLPIFFATPVPSKRLNMHLRIHISDIWSPTLSRHHIVAPADTLQTLLYTNHAFNNAISVRILTSFPLFRDQVFASLIFRCT